MVKQPEIKFEYDLTNNRLYYSLTYEGKSTASYVPYLWLGEGADPLSWEKLILFGWNARKVFDDEAQEPEGQPPSPA